MSHTILFRLIFVKHSGKKRGHKLSSFCSTLTKKSKIWRLRLVDPWFYGRGIIKIVKLFLFRSLSLTNKVITHIWKHSITLIWKKVSKKNLISYCKIYLFTEFILKEYAYTVALLKLIFLSQFIPEFLFLQIKENFLRLLCYNLKKISNLPWFPFHISLSELKW